MKTDKQLLDEAIELVRQVGHRHEISENGHRHLEFALGHLREAWIDRDGQDARCPDEIHEAIARWYDVADRMREKFRGIASVRMGES